MVEAGEHRHERVLRELHPSCASSKFCLAVGRGRERGPHTAPDRGLAPTSSVPRQASSSRRRAPRRASASQWMRVAVAHLQRHVVVKAGQGRCERFPSLASVSCPVATSSVRRWIDMATCSLTTARHGPVRSALTQAQAGSHLSPVPLRVLPWRLDVRGNVVTYNGIDWSSPLSIDPGAGGLSSVSCSTAKFCVAVDREPSAAQYSRAELGRARSGSTTAAAVPPLSLARRRVSAPRWTKVATSSRTRWLLVVVLSRRPYWRRAYGICATASFCAAVDLRSNVVVYNGSKWSSPIGIDPGGGGITSVSCPTGKFCVAVDRSLRAVTYDDGTWSAPVVIDAGGGELASPSLAPRRASARPWTRRQRPHLRFGQMVVARQHRRRHFSRSSFVLVGGFVRRR